MKKMSRSEWVRTPYAKSTASNPDQSIRTLLAKYRVTDIQTTECRVQDGRPAYQLRFVLAGKTYRVVVVTLSAVASPQELLTQAKRAVYHMLKATLEAAAVFFTPEETLFAFLELRAADGTEVTCYELARPAMDRMTAADFGRLMLGPAAADTAPGDGVP